MDDFSAHEDQELFHHNNRQSDDEGAAAPTSPPLQYHQPRCPVELNLDLIKNDASFPLWLYNFGNTIVEDHASALGNTLNLKTSMFEMGNENPTRVGNDGINSFGSSSIGFHAMEPNIQHF